MINRKGRSAASREARRRNQLRVGKPASLAIRLPPRITGIFGPESANSFVGRFFTAKAMHAPSFAWA